MDQKTEFSSKNEAFGLLYQQLQNLKSELDFAIEKQNFVQFNLQDVEKSIESKFENLQNLEVQNLEVQTTEVQALEFETTEVQNLEVEALEVQNLEVQNLEVQTTELQALEIQTLEVEALEVQNLEVQNLEVQTTELQALEIQTLEVEALEVQNLEIQNLEVQTTELQALEIQTTELQALEIQTTELQALEVQKEQNDFFSSLKIDLEDILLKEFPDHEIELNETENLFSMNRNKNAIEDKNSSIDSSTEITQSNNFEQTQEISSRKIFEEGHSEQLTDEIFIDQATHIPENINLGVFSLSHCGACKALKNQLEAKGVQYVNLQLDDHGERDLFVFGKFEENREKYGYNQTVPQIIALDDFPVGDYQANFDSKEYQKIFEIATELIDCKNSRLKNCFDNFIESYKSTMEDLAVHTSLDLF